MKRDSVFCAACSKPFDVGLLELVRWQGPMWCQPCIEFADEKLAEASGRARKAEEVLGER